MGMLCPVFSAFASSKYDNMYSQVGEILVLFVVLLLLFISVLVHLISKYKRSMNKKQFFSFQRLKPYLIILGMLAISILAVNLITEKPEFQNAQEKIDYGKRHGYDQYVEEGYKELINIYVDPTFDQKYLKQTYKNVGDVSTNLSHHEGFVQAHFDNHKYIVETGYLIIDYNKMKDVNPDIGNFGQAMIFYNYFDRYEGYPEKIDQAAESIDAVKLQIPLVNYYKGLIHSRRGERKLAIKYYEQEIKLKGKVREAYKQLINLQYSTGNLAWVNATFDNPETNAYFSFGLKEKILYERNDYGGLSLLYFNWMKGNANIIGFMAALLITLVWVWYLIKLDFFRRIQVTKLVVAFGLSVICVPILFFVSNFVNYTLGFTLTGGFFNDLLYCIVGIGLMEEIVKAIPFVIVIALFGKNMKQPYDYLIVACVSGLGFAFVENFGKYYTEVNADLIHSRALVTVFSHMFDSALLAYGVVLAKFKLKKNVIPYFIGFLLLAAFAHGFYDFWLISDSVKGWYLVTFAVYLISIRVWSDITTSMINQSPDFDYTILDRKFKLQFQLVYGLLGILLFEYICIGFKFGDEVANDLLVMALLTGSYLILYLATSLGRLDLIKGYWKPVQVPLRISDYIIPKMINPKLFIGQRITIRSGKYNKKLAKLGPLNGEIIDRKVLIKDTNWFVVQLDEPIKMKREDIKSVLIKFYHDDANLNEHASLRVLVRMPRSNSALKPLILPKKMFNLLDWGFAMKEVTK